MTKSGKSARKGDPIIVALEEYRRCRKLGLRLDRKLDAADWGDPSTPQRQEADRAYAAEHAAALRLAKTKPRTPAGAAEVLAYIVDEMDQMHGQAVWHAAAIGNIAAALRSM